tara:strand:- start:137 stop:1168 length:1032 start_codon:yes stop_codon:yes gene_type:complete
MSNQEILYSESISIRNLPTNFNHADLRLFEHELKKSIPATTLLHFADFSINTSGIIFCGSKVLPESFPDPRFLDDWAGLKAKLKIGVINLLLKHHKMIDRDVFWITDTWSKFYFHWMTDALPRLFTIREKIKNETLLLPGAYSRLEYVRSSLKPFFIREVQYLHETFRCKKLIMPTRTAISGNYNENVIRGLRSLYADYYENACSDRSYNKVYISRGKAQIRKIANEEECVAIMEEYGFKTIYFEDHSLEQQIAIALDAQYMISNHGGGLTNILFMKSGSSVLELRQSGDSHNNCYFSLASALYLKYYYQLCHSENPDEDAHTANLIVDCRRLRKNIEQILAN